MDPQDPTDGDYIDEEDYEGDAVENQDGDEEQGEDTAIIQMQRRMQEMEEEQDKFSVIQKQVERKISSASDSLDETSV